MIICYHTKAVFSHKAFVLVVLFMLALQNGRTLSHLLIVVFAILVMILDYMFCDTQANVRNEPMF